MDIKHLPRIQYVVKVGGYMYVHLWNEGGRTHYIFLNERAKCQVFDDINKAAKCLKYCQIMGLTDCKIIQIDITEKAIESGNQE